MIEDLNKFALGELARMITGEELGSGVGRTVYACTLDPSVVIKIETRANSFQNVLEWQLWHDHLQWCDWAMPLFAKPLQISPCGTVMAMQRTERPRNLPEWVPSIWTDLKIDNYGTIDGRLVCHDYGLNLVAEHGLGKKMRVRRAAWWDSKDMDLSHLDDEQTCSEST